MKTLSSAQLLLALSLQSCHSSSSHSEMEPLVKSLGISSEVMKSAAQGDAEAALETAHHAFIVLNDHEKGIRWLRIAASRGSAEATKELKDMADE
jgi:TPR repeat protein